MTKASARRAPAAESVPAAAASTEAPALVEVPITKQQLALVLQKDGAVVTATNERDTVLRTIMAGAGYEGGEAFAGIEERGGKHVLLVNVAVKDPAAKRANDKRAVIAAQLAQRRKRKK